MKENKDITTLQALKPFTIWGEKLENIYDVKKYKGKFLITTEGKLLIKLVPKPVWDAKSFFHHEMLADLDIKAPKGKEMMKAIVGGGKIELEMIDDYVECRFSGKSQDFGPYNAVDIDQAGLEVAIDAVFHLGMMTILVIPDYEA